MSKVRRLMMTARIRTSPRRHRGCGPGFDAVIGADSLGTHGPPLEELLPAVAKGIEIHGHFGLLAIALSF